MRFLLHSHDGPGHGYARHSGVAEALAEQAADAVILLVTSAGEIVRHGLPPQVEILKLPSLRKEGDAAYPGHRSRMSAAQIRSLRSAFLLTAVGTFQPTVVLVDEHPLGAGGEFESGLKALRRFGGHAVLGLPDILDEPLRVLREWYPYRMQQRIAKLFDEVMIYGNRAVFDPVAAYAFPPALIERTRFCGYVVSRENERALANFEWPFPPREYRARPVVLATAGDGEDGVRMLETFIRASANAPWQGVAVGGPMTPDAELRSLENLAAQNGVTFRNSVPHASALLGSLDALVCRGGYNTLVAAVALGVPTVCVPRVAPRTEQLIRAEAFARLGLLRVCRPELLRPETLRDHIAVALGSSPSDLQTRAHSALSFDGAQQAAKCLLALATGTAREEAGKTDAQLLAVG